MRILFCLQYTNPLLGGYYVRKQVFLLSDSLFFHLDYKEIDYTAVFARRIVRTATSLKPQFFGKVLTKVYLWHNKMPF